MGKRELDKQADALASLLDASAHKTSRAVEFFWLCDDCAAVMTLVYQAGIGVTTRRLRKELKAS